MGWFMGLTSRERLLVHQVWVWKSEGKPRQAMPVLQGKTLDTIISKLWHLYSSYKSAIGRVEEQINDIERLEDESEVEQSEQDKAHLDESGDRLKEIIDLLEWIRTEQHDRSFERL